jgi:phosphatidylinositol-3-phosphatase
VALLPATAAAPAGGPPRAAAATSSAPCGLLPHSTAPYGHIVVIMDENLSVPQWQATPDSPYTRRLATRCRLLANAAGETHPSFPNYMAVMSGTFPTPACLGCSSSADNLFHQLEAAGRGWRDYNQGMPANCSANTAAAVQYRSNHNPAFWFTDLGSVGSGGDGSCATKDVPLEPNFFDDAAANELKAFTWIAPDDCHNMHWRSPVCETETGGTKADRIAIGDAVIKQVVTTIAATPDYRAGKTLIVVTWDEANEGSVQAQGNWGIDCSDPTVFAADEATCRVTTILVAARLPSGPVTRVFGHDSLEKSIARNFGLAPLAGANRVTGAPIH